MQYPKKIMRLQELKKIGFPEAYLMRIYRTKGQTIAWKMNQTRRNSPIVFDTEGLEKLRQRGR